MIDVHAPHEPVMNWRDFFIHLITITIGLLIALSLEGCVEWQQHRHLVRDAEASLQAEIQNNAKDMSDRMDDLHKQQGVLKQDLAVLDVILKPRPKGSKSSLSVSFSIHPFEDVGWKTAQSTGAFAYMPYDRAQEYSDIYAEQNELKAAEQQAARDAIVALAPFTNVGQNAPDFTPATVASMEDRIEVLLGQMMLVDGRMKSLDSGYKKFLAMHPK